MSLQAFHPFVREWFLERFEEPTPAQAQGWPAIARGRHTLIAAPTGSGKTLAAFMTSIDSLVREGLNGGLPDRTEVVYVSPLKALSNDIRRNLSEPLAGIGEIAEQAGRPLPEIRTSVRTGDTSQSERQAMVKRPAPDTDHDPGVPVHPPDFRKRTEVPQRRPHPHPRRAARRRGEQARLPPQPLGRAAV